MDVFDLKSGSLYAVLAIASCVYLLWGFELRLRPLLKAILAVQVMGDLLFFNWIIGFDIYNFVKTLTAQDRIYPLLVLMACVFSMDGGAAFLKKKRERKLAPNPARGASGPAPGTSEKKVTQLKLNEGIARKVGITLVVLAVICKTLEVVFSGALEGSSWVSNILGWQPEMSAGFTFLNVLDVMLLPIGIGLLVMLSKSKPHWIAFGSFLLFGILSPWKGDLIRLSILYSFTIYQFGWQEIRGMVRAKSTLAAAVGVLLILPIKGQLRGGSDRVDLDRETLVESFVGSAGARAMGGVFQSYVYLMNSLERGYPTMGGRYNVQALYLWVPRLLWPNKPDTASEEIYYYLETTRQKDEPYGTAFAITTFGTFNLDFGFWGSIVSSLLLGALLALGERVLARLREARSDLTRVYGVAFAVAWLSAAFPLSEGGVPSAFTSLLIIVLMLAATMLIFANPFSRSRASISADSAMARRPWAGRIARRA